MTIFAVADNAALQHFRSQEHKKDADLALFESRRRKIVTRIFIAAAASLLLATPAIAKDGERSFTRDGVTYVYTSTTKGDAQILEGVAKPDNAKFRLVVRNGWVEGMAAGTRVSFRVPHAAQVQVAQR
jgi:hypothetical protein